MPEPDPVDRTPSTLGNRADTTTRPALLALTSWTNEFEGGAGIRAGVALGHDWGPSGSKASTRFQATLGGHQLGGMSEETAREPGSWQLGGPAAFQRELEFLAAGRTDGQTSNGAPQQASTARDLFTSSAFSLTVGNAEEGSGGFGALWGRGAVSRFDGRDGPLSLSDEVATGMVGIDWVSRRWRTGLALAMSRGIGGYSAAVNSGEIESKLTGLFPWVGYDVTDRVSVWATAGYGAGVLTFTPDSAEAMTAELAMSMVAAGARSELLTLRQLGGVMLALETDTRLTRTTTGAIAGLEATEASVWQRRLGLEGSRPVALRGRLSLRPSVEVGVRYDGGDAETGAGMDVGAGLGFADSGTGLAVDVNVRTLLVHQAEGFSERGVAFSLSWDPTPSTPLGVTARVAPSWGGQAQSGAAALWGRETMVGLGAGRRRARLPAQRRGRLRTAGGRPLRGDAAGGLRAVGAQPGLPGRLWPRGAGDGRPARRGGRRRAPQREPAGGRGQQRAARPGFAGLVRRGVERVRSQGDGRRAGRTARPDRPPAEHGRGPDSLHGPHAPDGLRRPARRLCTVRRRQGWTGSGAMARHCATRDFPRQMPPDCRPVISAPATSLRCRLRPPARSTWPRRFSRVCSCLPALYRDASSTSARRSRRARQSGVACPPQVQGRRMLAADRLLPRRDGIDGFKQQGDLDQLLAVAVELTRASPAVPPHSAGSRAVPTASAVPLSPRR